MDFVPLIDAVGEPATGALLGAGLGFAFGALALLTGFCTRSAVLDLTRAERSFSSLALWLAALALAIGGTQALIAAGFLDVSETRFFSTPQSLSGALIGGLAFGVGMILTRGCASRLLVLASGGNLRALTTIVIVAAVSWLTYQGLLVPVRNATGALANTAQIGGNLAGSTAFGLVIAAALLVAAIGFGLRARLSPQVFLGGAAIGALIPAGWWLTHELSLQVFEPIQAESLSFMRPLASTINFAAAGGAADLLSLDIGLIGGTIAGAFLAAILSGRFRIETFGGSGVPSFGRYALGGSLMGFGGILAVGCTIGAGFTGGAVLAISSLFGLAAMLAGAAITDIVLDRRSEKGPAGRIVPAE